VLNDPEAKISSPELNVVYRMSTDEYYEKTPYAKDLENFPWGRREEKDEAPSFFPLIIDVPWKLL
jgi:hypothetical protein